MSELPSSPPVEDGPESQEIDLRDLVAILLDGKWWIAGCAAVFLAFGVAYAFLARPVYRADVLLQIKKPQDILSGLNKIQEMLGSSPPADTEIQIIRSRAVLLNAITARDLTVDAKPREFPLLGRFFSSGDSTLQIASLTVPSVWEGKKLHLVAGAQGQYTLESPAGEPLIHGQVGQLERSTASGDDAAIDVTRLDARAGTVFAVRKQPALLVYQALNKRLAVSQQGANTGVLLMTLEGHDPAAIAATLNAIAHAYVAESARLQALQATQSLAFINKQLPVLQAQSNQAQAALSAYEAKQGRVSMSIEATALLNQAAQVQEQLTKVNLQNAQLAQQFTPDYPAIQALQQQRQSLLAQQAKVEGLVRSLPQTQRQLIALSRDAKVADDVYSYLLGKSEEFKIQQAGAIGNGRIIDLAVPPLVPVKPRKTLIVALALILGLLVGAGWALFRRMFMDGAEDPGVIERRFGRPVYAVIPHSRFQSRAAIKHAEAHGGEIPVLALAEPASVTIEALRSLRTSLNFALASASNRVVTVGGPRPGVGKSFVTVNLAYVLADSGKKVLLVDADLRRGHLHQYFSASRRPGLSQILSGECDVVQCLCPSKKHANVVLLPTGTLPPNPSELLGGERLTAVLAEASREYDVVLTDLPPYLAVTDGLIVAAQAATNLIVLRAGLHPLGEIEHVLSRLRQNHVTVSGFVMNDMLPRASAYGYRKYGYVYTYKYSSKRS